MILTGQEILLQVEKGIIAIDPFRQDYLNPNSYNYSLGSELLEITNMPINTREKPTSIEHRIDEVDGFLLQPSKLYLGHTSEVIGSSKYVASLIGRSSLGRLGLFLQITADLGQLGEPHQWTLELKVVQPLRVYAGMRIGQISFWEPRGDIAQLYQGGYIEHNRPHPSRHWDT